MVLIPGSEMCVHVLDESMLHLSWAKYPCCAARIEHTIFTLHNLETGFMY